MLFTGGQTLTALIGRCMHQEVFVLANGESFGVWDVSFGPIQRRDECAPCQFQEPDGKIRKGTIYDTVESAEVSFSAFAGSLKVDQAGQLSSPNDRFFEVRISSMEAIDNHIQYAHTVPGNVTIEGTVINTGQH